MKENIHKILFIFLLCCFILLFDDYYALGKFYFYFLIVITFYDMIKYRRISLLTVWNSAFLFIILSEVFSIKFGISNTKLPSLKFLTIANNFIILGYISKLNKQKFTLTSYKIEKSKTNKLAPVTLVSLGIFYFYSRIESALRQLAIGRVGVNMINEKSYFTSSISSLIGLILPALIAYYFVIIKERKLIVPFIFSSPIFFILFINGTRFPLLFSFIGFILVAEAKAFTYINLKKYLVLGGALFLLLMASLTMKKIRATGNTSEVISIFSNTTGNNDLPTIFAKNASPEGVIDMTSLMFKYFETNDHKYGTSSSFLLYFWIPRVVWPDKPTMLGHWLIRNFRGGFSSGHSASFGFAGELYSDFGLFSLLFIFFIGRLLKVGEDFKNWALSTNGYVTVLGAMVFPYVFFFVRSPITATINFLGILLFYFLIKRLILKR